MKQTRPTLRYLTPNFPMCAFYYQDNRFSLRGVWLLYIYRTEQAGWRSYTLTTRFYVRSVGIYYASAFFLFPVLFSVLYLLRGENKRQISLFSCFKICEYIRRNRLVLSFDKGLSLNACTSYI